MPGVKVSVLVTDNHACDGNHVDMPRTQVTLDLLYLSNREAGVDTHFDVGRRIIVGSGRNFLDLHFCVFVLLFAIGISWEGPAASEGLYQ